MRYGALALFLLGLLGSLVPEGAFAFPDVTHPPSGWQVIQHFEAPADQLSRFEQKFGCSLRTLDNTVLESEGRRVQVNLILCSNRTGADSVYALLVRGHGGDHRFCFQEGEALAEFVGRDPGFALRARYELGFLNKVATWEVEFDGAPLQEGDCSEWNELVQTAVAVRGGGDSLEARARLRTLSNDFTFASTLCLPRTAPGGHRIEYLTGPAAADTVGNRSTGPLCLSFPDPPRWEGLPSIHLRARVTVSAFTPTSLAAGPMTGLTGPTKWWPSDGAEVQELAQHMTQGAGGEREKMEMLLAWMMPGAHLRYGGGTSGSRDGVVQVLKQGHGHCWDFSDLFVSLCRAAGLPARQVGGWLVGGTGHVWAEIFLQGEGWLAVDPTAGGACGTEYVPLWTTDDGMVPLVYLSMPQVRKAGS